MTRIRSRKILVCLTIASTVSLAWFTLPHRFWKLIEPRTYAAGFIVNDLGDAPDLNPGDGACDSDALRGLQCTLRAAIQEANTTPALDMITFSIGTGIQTITPASDLPLISAAVIIDGSTQPGFSGRPIIELRGSSGGSGLILGGVANGSTVKSLVINSFNAGIVLATSNNVIQGNFIGTDPTGTVARGNTSVGILLLQSSNTVIGGVNAGEGNLISGNNTGIRITDELAQSNFNQVQGNLIGTDVNGMARLGNNIGVAVTSLLGRSVSANIIGGTAGTTPGGRCTGACNVISGNSEAGIEIMGAQAITNHVEGNYIGTNINGDAAVGNVGFGILINARNNIIGGADESDGAVDGVIKARNVISANGSHGISINGAEGIGNQIEGNFIGTDTTGVVVLPNNAGIYICGGSNKIGRAQPGAANLIAHNGTGVFMGCPGGTGNTVLGNSIHSNFVLGIDLFPDVGVTPNDPGDGDTGANNLQNFPQITSAITTAPNTAAVRATLNSTPNTHFIIDLFANDSCDASGNGEGQIFHGIHFGVVTDASGDAQLGPINFPGVVRGQFITATATRQDAIGNPTDTSEFSQCFEVTSPGTLQFSQSAYSVAENTGLHSATITVTRTGGADGNVSVNYSTSNGTATEGSDYTAASGNLGFGNGEVSRTFTVPIIDDAIVEGNETVNLTLSSPTGGAVLGIATSVLTIIDNEGGPTPTPTPTPPATSVQFSSTNFTLNEGCSSALIGVTRTGDTSGLVTVEYATADGSAQQRADYTISSGIIRFASGDTVKMIQVPVTEDYYVEGTETFIVTLLNPTGGAALGTPSAATVSIVDNSSEPAGNPTDDPALFVCQHYHDFLAREGDPGGLAYWTSQLTMCGLNLACTRSQRTAVSDAFFFEPEFQNTGAYVFRLYRLAFGNNQPFPNPDPGNLPEARKLPGYAVFARDRSRVTANSDFAQGRLDLANAFAARSEFVNRYPASLTAPAFVDAILLTIRNDLGVDLSSQRAALISSFGSGGRGAVLDRLADDNPATNPINNRPLIDAEYNRSFVFTEYAGYLRRDSDVGGFLFWLDQVNRFPVRNPDIQHTMACAFITSREYQERFSATVNHSNSECGP